MCFLGYLLRIWEKSVTIPDPRGICEKRPNPRSLLVNPGELALCIINLMTFDLLYNKSALIKFMYSFPSKRG